MSSYLIFGGAGYIGTQLAEYLLTHGKAEVVYIADIRESPLKSRPGILSLNVDVRIPIPAKLIDQPIDWIFNFAAIHREPGHFSQEYFETNIRGANHICAYADLINCKNIFFTSSISVYGPTLKPTDENTLTTPNTPYGISKLTAEYIHKVWAARSFDKKLIIVRPGVIYGPGDPGNILRMIRAVKKGYFVLPVSPKIRKSYGYILGLIESTEFMRAQPDQVITYNYVEKETESLGTMIDIINKTLGFSGRIIRFPFILLRWAAAIIHKINPHINGIHPERVAKVARPTHIIPLVLVERGFVFNYDFKNSLNNWKQRNPGDFD